MMRFILIYIQIGSNIDDALVISSGWQSTSDSILRSLEEQHANPANIITIVGNRNTGKSTFGRYLTNRLLSITPQQDIAFLDCDLGQPELTPSCLLSLHVLRKPLLGSPFTHLHKPYSCTFYGQTTPLCDPELYTAQLAELINIYQTKLSHLTLVVNTSGWIKGFII
jgi:polynucleotide 5'-kinase involved in rRNA processing